MTAPAPSPAGDKSPQGGPAVEDGQPFARGLRTANETTPRETPAEAKPRSRLLWWMLGTPVVVFLLLGALVGSFHRPHSIDVDAVLMMHEKKMLTTKEAIDELGGPERAAERLVRFVTLVLSEEYVVTSDEDALASGRRVFGLLSKSGKPGKAELEKLSRDPDVRKVIRQAAAEALKKIKAAQEKPTQ